MQRSSIPVMRLPARPYPVPEDFFRQEMWSAVTAMDRPAIIFLLPSDATLDSSAIDYLLRCSTSATAYDAEVAIVTASPEHRVLLELTRLSQVLPSFCSVVQAIDYLENSGRNGARFAEGPYSFNAGDQINVAA